MIVAGVLFLSPIFWVRFYSDDAMREYATNCSKQLVAFTSLNGFYVFERTVRAEYYLLFTAGGLLASAEASFTFYLRCDCGAEDLCRRKAKAAFVFRQVCLRKFEASRTL